jgi:hypothetical protein
MNLMSLVVQVLTTVFLVAMLPIAASASPNGLIMPGTPQAAQVMAQLKEAEDVDRMNYQSYLGSRENEVSMYYLVKHRHVVELMKNLQSGEPVSPEDVKSALDTSEAWRYGATF